MLRTGKQVWEASAKRSALSIRHEELQFHLDRYTALVTQCSVLAGFAFESIVHLYVDNDASFAFYAWCFASLAFTVCCSVYVVVTGTVLIVFAQQLALLGQEGESLEVAVAHLRKRRVTLFAIGFSALACLVSAGMALAFIKMGYVAMLVAGAFAATFVATMLSVSSIFCAIGRRTLVTGATKLVTPNGYFDLASLQPGAGDPSVLARYEQEVV